MPAACQGLTEHTRATVSVPVRSEPLGEPGSELRKLPQRPGRGKVPPRELASASLAEDSRKFPKVPERYAKRPSRRLGGGTRGREEAGWPTSGAPGEEAEMRCHFKGVGPPRAPLFPSPAAVGRGGECGSSPRPSWPPSRARRLGLSLVSLPVPQRHPQPASPPEVGPSFPVPPTPSSRSRLSSAGLPPPVAHSGPAEPLLVVPRRRPPSPGRQGLARSPAWLTPRTCPRSRRRHVRASAVDGRSELLQLSHQEE